jgi:hypothetical protein
LVDQRPILLCITPAPAVDRTARVARIEHREVLRAPRWPSAVA